MPKPPRAARAPDKRSARERLSPSEFAMQKAFWLVHYNLMDYKRTIRFGVEKQGFWYQVTPFRIYIPATLSDIAFARANGRELLP